jgi:hypothetical protein
LFPRKDLPSFGAETKKADPDFDDFVSTKIGATRFRIEHRAQAPALGILLEPLGRREVWSLKFPVKVFQQNTFSVVTQSNPTKTISLRCHCANLNYSRLFVYFETAFAFSATH